MLSHIILAFTCIILGLLNICAFKYGYFQSQITRAFAILAIVCCFIAAILNGIVAIQLM
jgi:hypothetical protein